MSFKDDLNSVFLLENDEPAAVTVERPVGRSPFFLTCDHAGNRIPRRLGDLGVAADELERHIAWDIGAAGVAATLSQQLDAILIKQTYSRLVIDCNRSPGVESSIPLISEHTAIPGNRDLTAAEMAARRELIFDPYHDAIDRHLQQRQGEGPLALVSVHSFTPVFKGSSRPWDLSLMYNRDEHLARLMEQTIAEVAQYKVGMNEPYHVDDETDYTIPVHGEKRGIPHVLIEIRQDLIETPDHQRIWGERLAHWLQRVQPLIKFLPAG
jgi:predicted N-formylglutamate amidohydrolase